MAITDEREESSAVLVADALRRKPSVRDKTSKLEWLAAIEEVFAAEKARPAFQGASLIPSASSSRNRLQ